MTEPMERNQLQESAETVSASRNSVCGGSDSADSRCVASRLPRFYELPIGERLNTISQAVGLVGEEENAIAQFGGLSRELIDVFIENAVGTFSLPLGIATNFMINGVDVLVPMAVEETSVVAAASHGAKLARMSGGFKTSATDPIMTGQIQLFLTDACQWNKVLTENKQRLIEWANRGHDNLIARGGGAKDLDWHFIPEMNALVLHLHIDTRDAMGANIVNTMCERVSGMMPELLPCDIGLRILTNLTVRRTAKAECLIRPEAFDSAEFSGVEVVDRIVKAYLFGFYDVFRATTNNKGIMNGIDPVLIATGNDWRSVEAGCHSWAARSGTYKPLAVWQRTPDGSLHGSLEVPMAVGVVGGVTKLHPTAQASLKILGQPSAATLAQIVVATGLAQNLSALRALASEGIQRGHMGLHQKNIDLLQQENAHSKRQGATRT
ncbi:MAG: hydroxymethylglutaryl-CoA reductase, degradative [Proteobacteria bacterium]|nr:hydroxymethylglutaryl-CoA reductase, degradative [Pseudomonadota bacterium]